MKFKVFDETSTGNILSKTMGNLNGISAFWTDTFINTFQGAIVFTKGIFVRLYISWQLTIVGFIFIPIVLYLVFKTSSIVGKAFTLEDSMGKKFNADSSNFVKAEKRLMTIFYYEEEKSFSVSDLKIANATSPIFY